MTVQQNVKPNKTKKILIIVLIVFVVVGLVVWNIVSIVSFLNSLPDSTPKGTFSNTEEAMIAYGNEVKRINDMSYDIWPPYEIVYEQECGDKVIVFFSCYYADGADEELKNSDYWVQEFKKNSDGTLSFDYRKEFYLNPKDNSKDLPFFSDFCSVNFNTDEGKKVIEYYYLPIDSDKDIYFGGVKAEKVRIEDGSNEFYLCYIIRDKKIPPFELFRLFFGRYKIK